MIPKTPSKIPGATDFAMATRAVSKKVGILWFALARIGAEVTGNALGGKFKGGPGIRGAVWFRTCTSTFPPLRKTPSHMSSFRIEYKKICRHADRLRARFDHSVVSVSTNRPRGGENPLTTGVKQAVPYRTGREARYLSVSTE